MHLTAEHELTTRRAVVDTVRRRLVVALLLEFAVLVGVVTLQAWPVPLEGRGIALVVAVATIVPVAVALLARRILAAVEALEVERTTLLELYGRARSDALVDALTGLGNHRAFQEELGRQLELTRRLHGSLALVLIDVDDLKKVNDQRGHVGGDELLSAVGRTVLAALRRSDRAFRVGGDEFAVLLPQATIDTGLAVARRILASALGGGDPSQPIEPFSLSIGVSSFPAPAGEAEQLYRQADAALYWCKRHGRTAVVGYEPGHHGAVSAGRSVEEMAANVGAVITARALRAVYQPIFSVETGEPIGYEGLVRPTEATAFPDAASLFMAAETGGRTVELDLTCLDIVAAGARTLEPGIYLAVNVSPRTLGSELFHPTELITIIRRHGLRPSQILIELTEREEVEDLEQLRRNVTACRQAGFRLAADDVGAGNSGLRLLSEIQFDTVKIDLSLVQGGVLHDPSHAVLRALQDLAAQWDASVVAEGVETPQQLSAIRQLGIAAAQGYLLGRPSATRAAEAIDLDALTAPSPLEQALSRSVQPRGG